MSTVASSRVSLLGLEPATYVGHAVHAADRSYPQTNCYADILLELLHARGDEPLALLGCTLRADFERDQFTFFKPHPGDVEELFGVDVHEYQPWRPLAEQARDQLAGGCTLLPELDSFYLPDTAATDYRTHHVKTTVAIEAIDLEARRLTYFHNAGLYELSGEDFDGVFRLGREYDADVLPPYVELARFDAGERLAGAALREAARERTRSHLARRPATNPFERFGAQLALDLPALLGGDADDIHAYAFVTVRMGGSGFELAAAHVRWLLGEEGEPAAAAFESIVEGCKILSFRLARRRAFDPAERVAGLVEAWEQGVDALDRALG